MNKGQTNDLVGRVAPVSMQIGQGVRAVIPVPPEQYLAPTTPRKVLDLDVSNLCG
jgi:hypothetical protein